MLNTITKQPILTVFILLLMGLLVMILGIRFVSRSIVEELALNQASVHVDTLNALQEFYSLEIVNRVGDRVVKSHNFEEIDGAIPIPATFGILFAEKMNSVKEGISSRIFSNYPFTGRKNGGAKNVFEAEALSIFNFAENLDEPYIKFADLDDSRKLFFAKPIIMSDDCVSCHNTHPESTKRDWETGDVRGARMVVLDVSTGINQADKMWLIIFFSAACLLSLLILVFIFFIIRALKLSIQDLGKTNRAYSRFVPHKILNYLNKKSIVDVKINDNVEKTMTVLFSDIRSFTTISENMSTNESFTFINNYMGLMGPIIRKNNGFIDKFIGDAIMALFEDTEDALKASLQMLKALDEYNLEKTGDQKIRIGIGLHRGKLMLGTVGEQDRMDGTVISDAVNLASRIESVTKSLGVQLLMSETVCGDLKSVSSLEHRFVGNFKLKGKNLPIRLYEVYKENPKEIKKIKNETRANFEMAVNLFRKKDYENAEEILEECLQALPGDVPTEYYLGLIRRSERKKTNPEGPGGTSLIPEQT